MIDKFEFLGRKEIILPLIFIAVGLISFVVYPKNISELKKRYKSGKKKDLIFWVSIILMPIESFLREVKWPALQKYMDQIHKYLTMIDKEEDLNKYLFTAIQFSIPLFFYGILAFSILRIPSIREMLLDPMKVIGVAFLLTLFGFVAPWLILRDTVAKHQKAISRELPFALDMLTSAVQAGLDFTGAIRRLVQKSSKMTPLKKEFSLMLKEINFGKTRSDALRRMADRVAIPDLNSVVSALIQADQLGTSLGTVLTNLSDDLRVKRFQKAEKLALEAPVKMIFPLVLFIFPSVFVILMGPIAVQLIATTK